MWGKKGRAGCCQGSAQLPPAPFLPPSPQLHPPLQSYQALSLLLLESVLSRQGPCFCRAPLPPT